jgi:polysaccharide transporter, PST family
MENLKSLQEHIGFARRLSRHPVAKNMLALYGIQFAGYVIPLVTLPYLSRVLRPERFGLLLFAQSFAMWVSITFEYGFNLSATREVAQNRQDQKALASTAAGVLGAKLMLLAGFVAIAGVAAFAVGNFRQHPGYLLWAIFLALAHGFSPFWYFQGTERMSGAVAVDFFARAAAAAAIFVVVRAPEDGWKALALLAATGCASTIVQTGWMYREIGFRCPRRQSGIAAIKSGWHMFLFRGAYNIYGTANTFVLGLFVPTVQVGYFGGAERIAKAVQGLTLPLTQALYPRMSHLATQSAARAARVARFTVSVAAGSGVALALILGICARWAVTIILGPTYDPSVSVLYVFALLLPINATNGALIMHWMIPLGMERVVGAITVGAILINLISASVLAPRFAEVGMAWAILMAETLKFAALVSIVLWRGLTPVSVMRDSKPQPAELS